MAILNILILGNCQAESAALAWGALRPQDNVAFFEVHLLIGKLEAPANLRRFAELADIIISQPISNDFPIEDVRTSSLKRYKAQVVTIPSFYFRGLQPDIIYVGRLGTRVRSPMGDYNSRIVLQSFLNQEQPEVAAAKFTASTIYEQNGYFDVFDQSLDELARRDKGCNVSAADILQRYLVEQPCLYTINHPMNTLVKDLIISVFRLIEISYNDVHSDFIPPSLSRGPFWPTPSPIIEKLSLRYSAGKFLKTDFGGSRILTFDEFIGECYQTYSSSLLKLVATKEVEDICNEQGTTASHFLSSRMASGQSLADNKIFIHGDRGRSRPLDVRAITKAVEVEPERGPDFAMQILWSDPSSPQHLVFVAKLMRAGGCHALADRILTDCIATPPTDPCSLTDLLDELLAVGNLSAVRTIMLQLLNEQRKNSKLNAFVARKSRQLGMMGIMMRAAGQLLQTAEIDPDLLSLTAHCLMDVREIGLVLEVIDRVISLSPGNPHHYALRGYAHAVAGNIHLAQVDYTTASRLAPDNKEFTRLLNNVSD